jgi:hypothetical protein
MAIVRPNASRRITSKSRTKPARPAGATVDVDVPAPLAPDRRAAIAAAIRPLLPVESGRITIEGAAGRVRVAGLRPADVAAVRAALDRALRGT